MPPLYRADAAVSTFACPGHTSCLRSICYDTTAPAATAARAPTRRQDRIVNDLGPGSLVINATGLGKDAPGSPITEVFLIDVPTAGLEFEVLSKIVVKAR